MFYITRRTCEGVIVLTSWGSRCHSLISASHLSWSPERITHVTATVAYSCHRFRMTHVYTFLVSSKGTCLVEDRVNLCFAAGARFAWKRRSAYFVCSEIYNTYFVRHM